MTVNIVTLGCRLNIHESEVIRARAREAGLKNAIIVNSCAVTAEAKRQARQTVRRARRDHPDARIIVTGCAAQIDPESFAEMAEVDCVLGNEEKLHTASYAVSPVDFGLSNRDKIRVNDIMRVRENVPHMIDGFNDHTRAFVQIQNGCDHRCTFCIIPFGRGNSRSVAAGAAVEQIRRLVARGYREVVLTGVDITAYGLDLPGESRLGTLVRRILKLVPELERLRLSSIDSIEVDEELMTAIAEEPRLMPHFHLSLQSGDNMILKRMKRRHLRDHAIAFCRDVRKLRPDAVFGADLIAGFPTETDAMFDNTLRIVEECGLTFLHVFPFSAQPGAPAARMPQVSGHVIKDRARRLREAASRRLADYLASQIGARHAVLLETSTMGRTPHYAPVRFATPREPGAIVQTDITAAGDLSLKGCAAA
ncbi:MAG: tRNA (N(6)-L-threonylcarbamoyladenosine(37)-C(2))-methylthiotransferase MtaB [Hyphomicrobiales bacterium]